MNQRRTQSHKIVKNGKKARIIARATSQMYGRGYKAIPTENGYIIGRKRQ